MRRYWDASALIDALHDDLVEKKALEPDQWTRSHTLTETFATLTGGRLAFRYSPDDAAALIRELTAEMNFVDLTSVEILEALDGAQRHGVRGGRVYDWLHACAAQKCKAAELLTDNLSDFSGLAEGVAILTP
jgi:predicted nucleic acid-binding protein